jgi:hypothetical protein
MAARYPGGMNLPCFLAILLSIMLEGRQNMKTKSRKTGRSSLGIVLWCAVVLGCWPSQLQAEEFNFFGVRFGMSKAEVDALWLPLSEGTYALPTPAVRQVEPLFNHEGKLYSLSFLIDLPPDYPPTLLNQAFSNLVESKWGRSEPDLSVNLVVSKNSRGLTVTHQKLRNAYIEHIAKEIAPLIQP